MRPYQQVVRLKQERLVATPERQDAIDCEIQKIEPLLTHGEAVFIVQRYEMTARDTPNSTGNRDAIGVN